MRVSKVIGVGSYLPDRIVTNDDLSKIVDTNDAWIQERTGIRSRRFAAEGQFTSDLGVRAAKAAMEKAGVTVQDVDLIVVATTTPDNTFPATATKIQAMLGISGGVAFDVQAVCAGFMFALSAADNMVKLGQAECALVIGAETFSRLLDMQDRNTCVLFGDGAGALVLRAAEVPDGAKEGVIDVLLRSDGKYYDALYVTGGPSSTRTTGTVTMNGKEVFRHAVVNMSEASQAVLARSGINIEDVDCFLPHQANSRIIEGVGKKLGIDPARVLLTVGDHANTSAASIPLAFDEAVRTGFLKPGGLVLLAAMGGGFTWGAGLLRYV